MAVTSGGDLNLFTGLYAASDMDDDNDDDGSSVDIYAGLDSLSVKDASSEQGTPSRDTLDLYEEILTEEGTAKEASHNDLQQQFENCQRQVREMMRKLKELQTQNLGLQNENQNLKKNISALIKTARVEINRKNEEINRLNQRLDFSSHHGSYTRTCASVSLNSSWPNISNPKVTKSRNVEELMEEHKHQSPSSKERHSSTGKDRTSHLEKSSSLSKVPNELISKNCIRSRLRTSSLGSSSDETSKKGRMEIKDNEHSNKLTGRSKKDVAKCTSTHASSQYRSTDHKQLTQVPADRSGKHEQCQESKHAKLRNSTDTHSTINRNNSVPEKQSPEQEKPQAREETLGNERVEKNDKSQTIKKKELNVYDKNRITEREQEEPRRSRRMSYTHSKSEVVGIPYTSRKSFIGDSRHGIEAASWRGSEFNCRQERRPAEHSSRDEKPSFLHSRENKYPDSKKTKHCTLKPEEVTRRHLEQEKNKTSKTSKADGESNLSESPNRQPPKNECRQSEAKNGKDKLSFMKKLDLTISPAKKNPLSENVQTSEELGTESSKQTQILPLAHNGKQVEATLEAPNSQQPVASGSDAPRAKIIEETTTDSLEEPLVHTIQSESACTNMESLPVLETVQDKIAAEFCPTFDLCHAEVNANRGTVLDDDLESITSDELETHSIADENQEKKSDLLIGMDNSNGCINKRMDPSPKQSSVLTVPEEDYIKLSQVPVQDATVKNIFSVNPESTECNINVSPSSSNVIDLKTKETEVKPDVHDENSIISVDLNSMRDIPAIISPLASPLRPLVKLYRVDCLLKASAEQSLNKGMNILIDLSILKMNKLYYGASRELMINHLGQYCLQQQFENCQRQVREMMRKLKELQTQSGENDKSQTIKKKELNVYDKNRITEREQEEPRRSRRMSYTHSKSEVVGIPYTSRKSFIGDSRHGIEAASWRGSEFNCRQERRPAEHSSRDEKPSFLHSRENKYPDSKKVFSNYERINKHSKPDRHRSEDKRIGDKGNHEETRRHRTEEKVTKHCTLKPEEVTRRHLEQEKNKTSKTSKADGESNLSESPNRQPPKNECRQSEAKNGKDKLSFMKKLDLTISPAKKNPLSENVQTSEELGTESSKQTQILPLAHNGKQVEATLEAPNSQQPVASGSDAPRAKIIEETTTDSLEEPLVHTIQSESACTNMESLPVLETVQDKIAAEFCPTFDLCHAEVNANRGTVLDDDLESITSDELETHSIADENQEKKSDLLIGMDNSNGCINKRMDPSPKQSSVLTVPEEDYIKLSQVPVQDATVKNIFSVNPESTECNINVSPSSSNVIDLKTKETEVKPDVHDENSIISVDLNSMRDIPAIISPLASPLRPLVKLYRVDCLLKASAEQSLNKDLPSDPGSNTEQLLNELNKGNKEPTPQSDKCLKTASHLERASGDIEEGEILSSEENETSQTTEEKSEPEVKSVEADKNVTRITCPEDPKPCRSTQDKMKNKKAPADENIALSVSAKAPVRMSRAAVIKNITSNSSSKAKQEKKLDIKDILNINHEPSKVEEVIEMLKGIHMCIRKKYMKFKVQFTPKQFHRIIESASSNFTTLIKSLDWSRMCSSSDVLKEKLCDTIQTKMNEMKKNGIVDRIFLQHMQDMKKKLWKFVDDQLNYLFDKIKKMLIKLCNRTKLDKHNKEQKLGITNKTDKCLTKAVGDASKLRKKNTEVKPAKSEDTVPHTSLKHPQPEKYQEKAHQRQSKKGKIDTNKNKSIHSLMLVNAQTGEECQKHKVQHDHLENNQINGLKKSLISTSINLQSEEKHEQKVQHCGIKRDKINTLKSAFKNTEDMSVYSTKVSLVEMCHSKEESTPGGLSTSMDMTEKTNSKTGIDILNKSDFNYELLTEQQKSSLTFNLVNESQMGEKFKSLFQDSHLLEQNVNSLEKGQWEFGTPEKQIPENKKCDIVPVSNAANEGFLQSTTDLDGSNISPEKPQLESSKLEIPVNPDVLDESCMLEDPTLACSSKDIGTNGENTKSCISSVLLEDLAVSLTIPSPLKSDSHLSFLKPHNISNATPEEVISAHFSEDALLEGEDATEQDIHLALESDNSSSTSSRSSSCANLNTALGFQCYPSQPMQAVIMEKSNDHFIVKIRHAFPVASPADDQALLTEVKALTNKGMVEGPSVTEDVVNVNSPITTMKGTEEFICNLNTVASNDATQISAVQELSAVSPELAKETASKDSYCSGKSVFSQPFLVHDLEALGNTVEITTTRAELSISCTKVQASDEPSESIAQVICIDLTEESLSNSKIDQYVPFTDLASDTDDESSNRKSSEKSKKRKKVQVAKDSSRKKPKNDSEVIEPKRIRRHSRKAKESEFFNKRNTPQKRGSQALPSTCSPNSLSAKNRVKKRGEVVMIWTRDNDRAILLECQKEGPSEQTFLTLADKLDKTSQQVAERFHQLMKLFKKAHHVGS
ncbi:CASP8-associated protein 2 [Rhinatrema bivittatum]|uniref:CASP8-associated protein 2 n=1 Tax=Rhinatrema bivittatum TaxID=194408 RepID=UPI001128567E|nr:CASP8-associated protein 2 [Rhinatrema bivittatum]